MQFPGGLPGGLAAWIPRRCLARLAVRSVHIVGRCEGFAIAMRILIARAIFLGGFARRVVDDELHDHGNRHRQRQRAAIASRKPGAPVAHGRFIGGPGVLGLALADEFARRGLGQRREPRRIEHGVQGRPHGQRVDARRGAGRRRRIRCVWLHGFTVVSYLVMYDIRR
jgi:hypothetical protein